MLEAVEQRVRHENELLVAPEFFDRLAGSDGFDQVTGIDLRVKRGRYSNELSRYRYDVVLHAAASRSLTRLPRLSCPEEVPELGALRLLLGAHRPDGLRVVGIPNGRLAHEVAAARLLAAGRPLPDVRRELDRADDGVGIDPESLHDLGVEHGYLTAVTWSGAGDDGLLDAVFLRGTDQDDNALTGVHLPAVGGGGPGRPLANGPGFARRVGPFARTLRAYLRERLPEQLVHTAVVVVEALPATASG